MAISKRQKFTIITLVFYWTIIFILTHLSPVNVSRLLPVQVSDKMLHFLAFLLLAFLLWFAINPDQKVKWHQAGVWWILLIVICYGAIDEYLQGYVGRGTDVMDFLSDLLGTITGLILLTIFSFWSAALTFAGIIIFSLANLTRINSTSLPPLTNAIFLFLAFGAFTLLWVRYIHHYLKPKPPEFKWLIISLALPIGFLSVVELFALLKTSGLRTYNIIISLIAVSAVLVVFFLTALLKIITTKVSQGKS
ncbi:MAG: VanZ family protein [Planctomycetota bacterium]|jgi:VanZ family protein